MRSFFIILIVLISMSLPQQALAKESYPYLAEVVEEKINVRAGVSTNFENLCQLQKGDQLVVVGRNYSWLKVRLPLTAESYISKKYVQPLDNNMGEIVADKVNVRAGASVDRTVLYQLKAHDQVKIISEANDFYKIEPSHADAVGWVYENLLAFKSKDVTGYAPQTLLARQDTVAPAAVAKSEAPTSLKIYGNLQKDESPDAKSPYVLTVSRSENAVPTTLPLDTSAVSIANLDKLPAYFLQNKVFIDGQLDLSQSSVSISVVKASKVHLVL